MSNLLLSKYLLIKSIDISLLYDSLHNVLNKLVIISNALYYILRF